MIRDINSTPVFTAQAKRLARLKPELLRFAGMSGDISYGYTFGNVKPFFITNKTALEEDIPLFDKPVFIDDVLGSPVVFIDLRNILKGKFNETKSLRDNIGDVNIFDAILLQLYYISYYSHSNDIIGTVDKVASIYGGAISFNLGQSLILNVDEIDKLNILITYKLLSGYVDLSKEVKRDMIVNIRSLRTDPESVEKIIEHVSDDSTFKSLAEDIVKADISNKTNKMDASILQTTINSIVFGIYPISMIGLALQHLPTGMALLYLIDTSRSFKKTKLKYYLDNTRKITAIDDLLDIVKGDLKIVETTFTSEDDTIELANNFIEIIAVPNAMLLAGSNLKGDEELRLYIYDINFESNDITKIVTALTSYSKETLLTIVLHSQGGYIDEGLRLINTIQNHFKNIHTVLDNTAKSMGTIFQALGSKRTVYEFSDIMYHTSSGGARGKSQEVTSRVDHYDELYKRMNQVIVVDRGFLTKDEFTRMRDGADFWYNAEQMLEKGIATHIIYNGKELTAAKYLGMKK